MLDISVDCGSLTKRSSSVSNYISECVYLPKDILEFCLDEKLLSTKSSLNMWQI